MQPLELKERLEVAITGEKVDEAKLLTLCEDVIKYSAKTGVVT